MPVAASLNSSQFDAGFNHRSFFVGVEWCRWLRSEFGTIAPVVPATVKFQNRNMKQPRNIVGPQIRALRVERGLTQPMLAAKCHLLGWDLSRKTLAKIEG